MKNKKNFIMMMHENNYVKYIFKKHELKYIYKILNELEEEIGKKLIEYLNFTFEVEEDDENDKKEENEFFEYSINNDIFTDEKKYKDKFELIARWCLGKQIKECIENKYECEIFCEI